MGRKKLTDVQKKERQRERDAARESLRDRWITIICFEEILDDQLIPRLSSLGVPFCISPLHDKDINADGSPKKPHRHVLFHYSNEKYLSTLYDELRVIFGNGRLLEFETGQIMFDEEGVIGIPRPQKLFGTPAGLIRYMKHLDNPDKYQYNEDPEGYCGFDVYSYLYSSGDELDQIRRITELIDEYDVSYPHQLVGVLFALDLRDLQYLYFQRRTYMINSIIAGKRHYSMDQRDLIARAAEQERDQRKRP